MTVTDNWSTAQLILLVPGRLRKKGSHQEAVDVVTCSWGPAAPLLDKWALILVIDDNAFERKGKHAMVYFAELMKSD